MTTEMTSVVAGEVMVLRIPMRELRANDVDTLEVRLSPEDVEGLAISMYAAAVEALSNRQLRETEAAVAP